MPADFWTNPLMYQGGSDAFLGPRDPILVSSEAMELTLNPRWLLSLMMFPWELIIQTLPIISNC